jgi:hypothetical protein
MRYLVIGLATVATALPTAAAVPDEIFNGSRVNGVRIVKGKQPPTVTAEVRTAMAPGDLCAILYSVPGPLKAMVTDRLVAAANDAIRAKVSGVSLVRYNVELSDNCGSYTSVARIQDGQSSDIVLHMAMRGNRFTSNLTTPDASIFGAKIGAPQSADPRLSVRFDLTVDVTISSPSDALPRFGTPRVRARVANVSLPRGENPTGEAVAWLADVGSSIYDHFNNGIAGKSLASGLGTGRKLSEGIVEPLNAAIARDGGTYSRVSMAVGPGDMLDVNFNNGEKVIDPRCINGFVWRQVRSDDLVCVTPETRAQVRSDNAKARERVVPPSPGEIALRKICLPGVQCESSAPRPCLSGFVWREAVAGDYVCVTPATRDQAKEDNRWERRRRMDWVEVIH